jgi:hypothetical protein
MLSAVIQIEDLIGRVVEKIGVLNVVKNYVKIGKPMCFLINLIDIITVIVAKTMRINMV